MPNELIPFLSENILHQNGLRGIDFYQHSAYVQLDADQHQGHPYIFLLQTSTLHAAVPIIKMKIPYEIGDNKILFDGVSPYGYAGILFEKVPTQHEAEEIISKLLETARQNEWVSLFIRLNPFSNTQHFHAIPGVKHVLHGETVYIDLQKDLLSIRNQYSTNHKRDIRTLLKAGFITRINDWNSYASFQSAYLATMQQADAKAYYYFDSAYFDNLVSIFNDDITLVTVHDSAGLFTSGAIFISTGNLVQYHLGGTAPEFKKQATSKLVFDTAISYFHDLKKNILHLGGGFGAEEDALFRFKAGFSSDRKRFSTLRLITDPVKYKQLTALSGNKEEESSEGFFPSYRR